MHQFMQPIIAVVVSCSLHTDTHSPNKTSPPWMRTHYCTFSFSFYYMKSSRNGKCSFHRPKIANLIHLHPTMYNKRLMLLHVSCTMLANYICPLPPVAEAFSHLADHAWPRTRGLYFLSHVFLTVGPLMLIWKTSCQNVSDSFRMFFKKYKEMFSSCFSL